MADKPRYAWHNGEIVNWEAARMHVTSGGGRGIGCFEGLRAYWSAEEGELFAYRLGPHYRRLVESVKMLRFKVQVDPRRCVQSLLDTLRANEYRQDVHIIHSYYLGDGEGDVCEYIAARPSGRPRGFEGGLSVQVSSWNRIDDRVQPPRVKGWGNYYMARLLRLYAQQDGYDEALVLNSRGKVAEAPGACMFMVKRSELVTPPVTASILESITRATLIELAARELGLAVHEREIDRTELYIADEVFLAGTAAEVTPVVQVDRLAVGSGAPGPVTRRLQDLLLASARGKLPAYREWCTPTYARVATGE